MFRTDNSFFFSFLVKSVIFYLINIFLVYTCINVNIVSTISLKLHIKKILFKSLKKTEVSLFAS